jgi:hypothetical protein
LTSGASASNDGIDIEYGRTGDEGTRHKSSA